MISALLSSFSSSRALSFSGVRTSSSALRAPAHAPSATPSTAPSTASTVQPDVAVTFHISAEAQARIDLIYGPERSQAELGGEGPPELQTDPAEDATNLTGPFGASDTSIEGAPKAEDELTREEKVVLEKMRARDSTVRAHEEAHVAAAGGHAGMPTYDYQIGPDGKRYAIGGKVSIDTVTTGSSETDADKARAVRSAALAPGSPSPRDYAVAASASRMEGNAWQNMIDRHMAPEVGTLLSKVA